MSSVTKRYGTASLALIVLPLVSAFSVDRANAFVIRVFVALQGRRTSFVPSDAVTSSITASAAPPQPMMTVRPGV